MSRLLKKQRENLKINTRIDMHSANSRCKPRLAGARIAVGAHSKSCLAGPQCLLHITSLIDQKSSTVYMPSCRASRLQKASLESFCTGAMHPACAAWHTCRDTSGGVTLNKRFLLIILHFSPAASLGAGVGVSHCVEYAWRNAIFRVKPQARHTDMPFQE